MVAEVQRQFSKVDSKGKTLLTGSTELKPDSKTCIQISTQAGTGWYRKQLLSRLAQVSPMNIFRFSKTKGNYKYIYI